MFYLDNGEWKPNTKKITYRKKNEAYDIDDYAYRNNPKFEDVVVEDVVLTVEQKIRLERVKKADTGVNDIKDYVVTGIVNPENEQLKRIVEDAELRDLVAKYVPQAELDSASITMEVM